MSISLATALRRSLPALLILLLADAPASGQETHPVATGTGLLPEEAAKAMTLPAGFQSTLFAGEPDVHQPIAFTIDERGRLWVVENYSYPNWAPHGRDRVVIYEDTDGDGRFNTSKVFYDQLNFASAIAVGHGGVWVGSPPYLLFIPDRNRDDAPDGPAVDVLDGWGHDDTHETLNSFVWGPDGWLYGNQGIFTHSDVGRPGFRNSNRTQLNASVWRYHPTKKIFEVFAHGMSNQWGLDFNDYGDAFVAACVIPHLWHVVQGGTYQRQSGSHFNPYVYDDLKTIGDHVHYDQGINWIDARMRRGGTDAAGGGHAHAGTLIYLGDSFPDEYRGSIMMHNVLGNRINRDVLEPAGSGYIGRHAPDFMNANDGWFRGLRLELGPDGSVFSSDWYDPLACHAQQPQDRTNGRIYKLSYGNPEFVQVDLSKATSAELVQHQLHPNEWFVRRSRLILQERGPDPKVHSALIEIIRTNTDVTRQLRALWTLHVTGGFTETLAHELLGRPQEHLRAWTIQLSCEDRKPSDSLLAAFAKLALNDPSPVVRRFLASAAQRISLAKRWPIVEGLVTHGEDATDHNLPLMYWFAIEPLVAADPARSLALASTTPLSTLRSYVTRRQATLGEGAPQSASGSNQSGGTDAFAGLLAALKEAQDVSYQKEIIDSLLTATEGKSRLRAPAGWGPVYAELSVSPDEELVAKADALASRFGDRGVWRVKREVAGDTFAPLAARQAALKVLLQGRDIRNAPLFQQVLPEPGLRIDALRGLAEYDTPSTPSAIIKNYASFTLEEKRIALGVLASRPTYARALVGAVQEGSIDRGDLDVSLVRQLRLLNDPELDHAVTELVGVVRESPQAIADEIAHWKTVLTPERIAAANASRGRVIYAQTCAMCHSLFDEGQHIGPELTGSNRADLDYLLTNIVDPNAVIGHDYLLTTVETNEGRVVAGIVQRETPSTITIASLAETVTLSRDSIKEIKRFEMSLMPPGLLQSMKEDQVADLILYLSSATQVPLPPE